MKYEMHPTHKWRYSDSSIYDSVCELCNIADIHPDASEPCSEWVKNLKPGDWGSWYSPNRLRTIKDCDIGKDLSEETKQALKEIDNNIRNAIMNAHKIWCD